MNDTPLLNERPRWSWPMAGLIVLLAFASYVFVLFKAQWIWDDPDYIWRNPNLVEENGLQRIWESNAATPQYYPVVHTTFWLEYQIVDPERPYLETLPAQLFHFNNVLIFALTALVFWKVLLRLRIRGALIAVLLFTVHPINVESVAWVTERKNMLSGLFALLTVLCFLRFMRIGDEDDDGLPRDAPTLEPWRWKWFGIGFVWWVLGVLSKSVIAFVPPALFLVLWWKRPKDLFRKEVLGALLLLLIPGAVAGLHTAWLERTQVGAEDVFFPELAGGLDRLMLAGTVVWMYLKHLLLPIEQMFFYPKWDPDAGSLWQWGLLLAAIALPLTLLWKSKQWGRGPLVAVLIFGGALFPVMGFANVYPMRFSWVADHFQYHANFAMYALIGALLVRIPLAEVPRKALLGVTLVGGVLLSNHHGRAFENGEALWRTTIASNPECWLAHQNLGVEVNKRAVAARAEGNEQLARQLEQEAQQHMYNALEFERDPHLLQSLANNHLGWYSQYKNPADLNKAEALVQEALLKWERYGLLHKLMGDIHLARGNVKGAYESYDFALNDMRTSEFQRQFLDRKLVGQVGASIAINWSVSVLNYGKQLLDEGKPAEALALWERPREPYGDPGTVPLHQLYTWGPPNMWLDIELHRIWMLAAVSNQNLRDPEQALKDFEELARVSGPRVAASGMPPTLQQSYMIQIADLRAAIMASLGRFREAQETSSEAIRQATQLGAPPVFLDELRKRNQIYRQKTAYRFSSRVPVFG